MLQLHREKLNRQTQIQFLIDLSDSLTRGFSLSQALQIMHACAEEIAARQMSKVVVHIQEKLAQGRSLSESLLRHFDADLVLVMKSSHDPNQLKRAMLAFGTMHQERKGLTQEGIKKLLYPCILLLASVVAVWFAGAIILPRLEAMASGPVTLHWSSYLKGAAKLVPWLLFVGAGALVGFLVLASSAAIKHGYSLAQSVGEISQSQVYRLFILAGICYSLGMLLGQQVSLNRAVQLLQERATGQAKRHYAHMQEALALGVLSLTDVMRSTLVDRITLMQLQMSAGSVRERSEQLQDVASSLQQRAVRRMQKHLWLLSVICYSLALGLIALLGLGLGQAVSSMVTEWV
ncbi:type II secretion system F family protein [Aliidiomarina taiwanensis]|nr:type II secretion system F family protein [Aliidiomarina taiwanensis]